MAPTSSTLPYRHDNRLFPPWFVWPLFFLTSSLRVYYVLQPRNWWIVHPDEIFQTMEVAHSEVYGYGFRTYEFNPEPAMDELTPGSRRNEAQHGLWALRSYLLPHVYVLVMWLLGILGLDFPPFVTWKVFHTLVASTLVPVVHLYVSVVFRSHDTACLAAIMCAACCQLTVLGTHTLVNSLVAPPVFLALTHLHTLVSPPDAPDSDDKPPGAAKLADCKALRARGNERHNAPDPASANRGSSSSRKGSRSHNHPMANGSGGGRLKVAERSVRAASQGSEKSPLSPSQRLRHLQPYRTLDGAERADSGRLSTPEAREGNGVVSNSDSNRHRAINSDPHGIPNDSTHQTTNHHVNTAAEDASGKEPLRCPTVTEADSRNDCGLGKSVAKPAQRARQESRATTTTTTTLTAASVTASTTVRNGYAKLRGSSHTEGRHRSASNTAGATEPAVTKVALLWRDLAAGFALGACVYVRVDAMALVAITTLAHWRPFRARYLRVVSCAGGALAGVGLGVSEDFRCYGWGVLTPYNWFRFNVQKDYASLLFGRHTFYKYVVDIVFLNVGTAALAAVAFLCAVSNVLYVSQPPATPAVEPVRRRVKEVPRDELRTGQRVADPADRNSALVRTGLSWLVLLFLYSSKGHKELRFVHNVIVLMLVTCAGVIHSALARRSGLSRDARRLALYAGVTLFALSQWRDVVGLTDDPKFGGNKMALSQAGDTQDVNQCLYLISARSDVTGVFIDRSLYATGGYSVLHRDVPVFSMFGTNFHEYSREFRWTEPSHTILSRRGNMSVSYVGRFSNYLSWLNARYVIKFVVQDPRYNYLVIKAHNDFSTFGFDRPLFYCGAYKVLKRSAKPTRKQAVLFQNAVTTPPLNNASLLTHEADMLFFHGAWARASERFRDVLRVDPSQVGVYVPLAASLYRQGDEAGSAEVMRQCYVKFGAEACERRRLPMVTNFASSNSES